MGITVPLSVALSEFFALPNWQNRVGEWDDVRAALDKVMLAYSENVTMRHAVQWFAEQMENQLRQHEARNALPRPTQAECWTAINRHLSKMQMAWQRYERAETPVDSDAEKAEAIAQGAHLANWMLMLFGQDVRPVQKTATSAQVQGDMYCESCRAKCFVLHNTCRMCGSPNIRSLHGTLAEWCEATGRNPDDFKQ